MTVTLTYDTTLSRVRITATELPAEAVTALVERSTDQVRWTTVRGGVDVTVTDGVMATVDDYEFPADVTVTYRITPFDASAVPLPPETGQITPILDGTWLKVPARPFLNRRVTVRARGDIARGDRAGVFPIVGRSLPVEVSDVHGSRSFTLGILTRTAEQARTLDLVIASGETIFLHAKPSSTVPTVYASVGATGQQELFLTSTPQDFTLPLTEVAPPAPDVVGAAGTWTTVINAFADWTGLLAAEATWNDVLELIGDPDEVVVP